MTTAQISVLHTHDIVALSTEQVHAMTTDQIQALTTAEVHAFETRDIVALTTDHIQALHTHDIVAMTTDQIHALTTDQIVAFHTHDIVAMTTSQIAALSTEDIAAMTTTQFHAMETADIAAMTTDQIVALQTEDILVINKDGKAEAFTAAQVNAMNTDQLDAWLTTPIALDLDGNGIQTVGAHNGVSFDITGSGIKTKTGWIAGKDGFLVRDINQDGVVNDGGELFGSATHLASGVHAKNGFEALSAMDSNHDGVINIKDINFNELKVWIDANHDGISQANEMHSLQSLGISQLNLNATRTAVGENGNWTLLDSTYTSTDGTTHQMADVWLEKGAMLDLTVMSTDQVAALTPDQIHDLSTDQIHSMTPVQVAVLSTADVAVLSQDQVLSLSTEQVHAFTPDQIHAMSTDQVQALTPDQVHALSTEQIHALAPDQIAMFSTDDVAALSHDQIQSLTLEDVAALQELGKTDALTQPQLNALIKNNLASGLDDVLFSGNTHVHTNVVADSEQLQVIVTGDATGKVDLVGQAGDWKDAGSMLVNGAESHIYNNGHTQIVVQGSVTAAEKNLLLG